MHIRKNRRERIVINKYVDLGYEVLTKGWPDLLIFNDDEVFAIEVKRTQKEPTEKMGLSAHQKKCHELLRRLGVKVLVQYID